MKKRWRWDSFDDAPEDKNETPKDGDRVMDRRTIDTNSLGASEGAE